MDKGLTSKISNEESAKIVLEMVKSSGEAGNYGRMELAYQILEIVWRELSSKTTG